MTRSLPAKPPVPRPVPERRYRYSKWRWRILVTVLDTVGSLLVRLWRLVRPIASWNPPRRILIAQLDHLGDAVLSTPLFPSLKAIFPDAEIDVLASPSNASVFQADPNVGRVVIADRNWFERRPGRWALGSAVWKLGRFLRTERYDLGIDVRGDVLTVFVLALAGIPRRFGWAMGGGGFLLTDLVEWVPGRHEVRSRMAIIETLQSGSRATTLLPKRPRVSVQVSDSDRARVGQLLKSAWPGSESPRAICQASLKRALTPVPSGGSSEAYATLPLVDRPTLVARSAHEEAAEDDSDWLHAGRFGSSAPILAVHLGAGTQAKRWPIRYWKQLLQWFLADGWRVVVVGGQEDLALADQLTPDRALLDLTGQLAVTETTALLERADLYIGADSGPAHLASCAGVPSVILFSGTNRVGQWRPWSRTSLVLRRAVPCRPCHQKNCPLADHPCMTKLNPEDVYRTARRWWARLHRWESPHAPI